MDEIPGIWLNLEILSYNLSLLHRNKQNETGNNQLRSELVVMNLIESKVLEVLEDLTKNKKAILFLPNRQSTKNQTKKLILNPNKEKSAIKFAQFFYILSEIYQLITTNKICTKRDLFYRNIELFKKQTNVDQILDDIACWFQVTRNSLHVVAAAKGLVSGDLKFNDANNEFVDCSNVAQGYLIPSDTHRFSNMKSTARFVLLVEKDAIFHKLLGTNLSIDLKCIIVTGKGFPDLNTRHLIAKIWNDLKIPILVLVDCDPYGIEIMCVYRFGSLSLQHESNNLIPQNIVKWLGLFPEDVINLNLNAIPGCTTPLTAIDQRKSLKLLEKSNKMDNKHISRQLELLLLNQFKAELESLDKLGTNYLSNIYLPNKIRFGEWI